jgi:hypothetical protein
VAKAIGEEALPDSGEGAQEIRESAWAEVNEVPDDKESPAFPDDVERFGNRAVLLVAPSHPFKLANRLDTSTRWLRLILLAVYDFGPHKEEP